MDQDPLISTVVRGCLVDISHPTISRFLYGPTRGHSWSLSTVKFEYRWDIERSGAFQRNTEHQEVVILWLAKYIDADGERAEWVAVPRLGIRKATLNLWPSSSGCWVSPTKADNQLTWDRAIMVATLVARVEIDFARMLLSEIHERAFKTSTTYPFPCLIFQLCRGSGVPIWHCDRLINPTGTLDIGLIRDEANVAAPRREPQIEVPPLGADLADTVGQLGATIVPLARVTKLEAQMATLLHHIQPWMQKSIAESEDRMETELTSLWTDIDAILSTPTVEPQAAPTALADDTVLDALFSGTVEEGLEPTHAKGKRHRSNRTEEEKVKKRQRRQEKEARKDSILEEQLRQQRVRESVVGASSSAPVVEVPPVMRDVVSTTDGAMMDDVGTTEGDPTIAPAGSGKPDPPARS
uniref:Integrase core domain containing protein n=1 Tax=Solanum tuberosum TaxID=4113 RepID=M1DJI0_SOLTU